MTTTKALIIGSVGAVATIIIAILIPKSMALELLFAILVAIAFVYFGFVLMDGRAREMLFEFENIALTLTLAFLGLWVAPVWLAAGYLAHGLWDVVHHPRGIQTKMPQWYVPFCLVYDWIVAGFIILWWR